MTSLVLALIEDRAMTKDLTLAKPVATLHQVSHDPTLQAKVTLRDGGQMTALELLWEYHDAVAAYLDVRGLGGESDDPHTAEVMRLWGDVLHRLETDPSTCAADLDWVAKQQVLEGYRERDGLDWSDPRLRAIDIQWSDVRPEKGLFRRLADRGRMTMLVDDAAVEAAVTTPPEDTRAWFRGTCLDKWPTQIAAASWDSVIFDVPGRQALQRVPMLEPERGTKAHVGAILDRSPDVITLLRELDAAAG
jgi:proteasome accessory factor A